MYVGMLVKLADLGKKNISKIRNFPLKNKRAKIIAHMLNSGYDGHR
jgi:hypothetical protein